VNRKKGDLGVEFKVNAFKRRKDKGISVEGEKGIRVQEHKG